MRDPRALTARRTRTRGTHRAIGAYRSRAPVGVNVSRGIGRGVSLAKVG